MRVDDFCPVCFNHRVTTYVDPYMLRCESCGTSWSHDSYYENEVADAAANNPANYIDSGELNADVQALVEAVEIRLLKDLEMWLPTLDRYGNGEIPVAVLVNALRDVSAGRRMQAGL